MTLSSYANQYGAQALAVQRQTGFPAALLLAISFNEGGDSPGTIAHDQGAFFGVKSSASQPSGDVGTITVPTREYINGQYVTVTSTFNAYRSFQSAAQGFIDFLRFNSRYQLVLGDLASGAGQGQIAQDLQSAGYATDPQWSKKLLSLASSISGALGGSPGNTIVPTPPSGGGFNPDPNAPGGPSIGSIPMPGGPTPPGTPRTPAEADSDPCASAGEGVMFGLGQIAIAFCRFGRIAQRLTSPGLWWAILLMAAALAAIVAGVWLYVSSGAASRLAAAARAA